MTTSNPEQPTKSMSQIVAEFEAAGTPVPPGIRQQAEAEQSGDWAVMLGFERPSRKRRIELFGKAIDPWDHKQADEERRREGLRPVYFRRLRRLLTSKAAKPWIILCGQSLVGVAVVAAGISYIRLDGFKAVNLMTVERVQSCRTAAVTIATASDLRAMYDESDPLFEDIREKKELEEQKARKVYLECQLWARSGFGVIPESP